MTDPDPENIERDRTYFYAVWSPGQYMVPGSLMQLGLDTGTSLVLVCLAFSILALVGWGLLFRVIGFAWPVVISSLLAICLSRTFSLSLISYIGGDHLSFAAFPWLAAAVFSCRRKVAVPVVAFAGILLGFFFKNSLAIHMAIWSLATVVAELATQRSLRQVIQIVATVVAVVVGMISIHVGYTSQGWSPIAYKPTISNDLSRYFLPIGMPLMSGTSADDLLARVFDSPGGKTFDYRHSTVFMGALAGISTAVSGFAFSRPGRPIGTPVAVLYVVGAVIILLTLYASGSAASLWESRHYRIPGVVVLPFIIQAILGIRHLVVRYTLLFVLALPCAYGVMSFAANWHRLYQARDTYTPTRNVTHPTLTQADVQFLNQLDQQSQAGSSLVVVSSPAHALEFNRHRVLATNAVGDDIDVISTQSYQGRVDNIIVIAERKGFTSEKLAAWLACFSSYEAKEWDLVEVHNWIVCVPSTQQLNRAVIDQLAVGGR